LPQKIATGFNRNHRGNAEGGIIPEEYAVEYVVDRVDTTATYGSVSPSVARAARPQNTIPSRSANFIRSSLFSTNVPEKGARVKIGNSPPYVLTPTLEQEEQLATWTNNSLPRRVPSPTGSGNQERAGAWEESLSGYRDLQWAPSAGLQAHFEFERGLASSGKGTNAAKFCDGVAAFAPGVLGQAAEFDGRRFIHAATWEISASSTSFP